MLTEEDLEQIDKLMDGGLESIRQDIQGLKDGQVRLEQKMDKNLEVLAEFIQEISAEMDGHDTRIKRLEDHTGLSHS